MQEVLNQQGDIEQQRDPREIMQLFEKAEDLPTLPEVAIRLQRTVDDPYSNAKDVARIISDDPAISTRVLRMVNSVFYAPSHGEEITDLQPAIARLGFITVTNIALSTSVFHAFARSQMPVFDRREFWRHSICVGIVTSVLYDFCGNSIHQHITRDMAHLSGIVHDMGKILFERYANHEFHKSIENAVKLEIPVVKEEKRLIGMSHDEAGAWLANKWNLGKDIQAVIQYHHDPMGCPDPAYQSLVKLVHMADYICHNQNLGESGNPCALYDKRIREELRLTPEKIGEIMDVVEIEAANSEVLLTLTD